jgi:hypothetical protein
MRSAVGDARAHFSQMRHSVLDSSFLIDLLNEITSGKAGPFSLPLRRHAPALFGALHAFESWKHSCCVFCVEGPRILRAPRLDASRTTTKLPFQ